MPRKSIETFSVEHLQILDQSGAVDPALEPRIPAHELKSLYRTMLKARMVDDRMYKLQAQGRIGTFPGVRGQEACLGCVFPLRETDWLVPAFRETACLFWRGIPIKRVLEYYMGMEEGNLFPEESKTLPIPITVGSQTLHAAGLAWASKIKGDEGVTLVFFGDGGTSEGDFHEACNMAGIYQLPVVFVCMNNQWAISVPRKTQSHAATLAQKAIAYGFTGIQVDGNDILATATAAKEAIDRARQGGGPSLIECLTYRLGPHTTADDPKRYRNEEEVALWKDRDPLVRFRKYLETKNLWTPALQAELEAELTAEIEEHVLAAEAELAAVEPLEMFDHVYAEKTPDLIAQKEYAAEFSHLHHSAH